jgi:hypothetical protein
MYTNKNLFSKLHNIELFQDGASDHCFILLRLTHSFHNRPLQICPFWIFEIRHFHILPDMCIHSQWSQNSRWRPKRFCRSYGHTVEVTTKLEPCYTVFF